MPVQPPAKLIIFFLDVGKVTIVGSSTVVHINKLNVTVSPLNYFSACVLCDAVVTN
jgi:hypothetical protein